MEVDYYITPFKPHILFEQN